MATWTSEDYQRSLKAIEEGKKKRYVRPSAAQVAKQDKAAPAPKKPRKKYGKKARIRLRTAPRGQDLPDRPPRRIIGIDPSLKTAGVAERTVQEGGRLVYTALLTLDAYQLTEYLQQQARYQAELGGGGYCLLLIEDALQRDFGSYGTPASNQAYARLKRGMPITEEQHRDYRTALMGSGYAKSASIAVKQAADHLGLSYAMLKPSGTKAGLLKGVTNKQQAAATVAGAIKTITGLDATTDGKFTDHVYDAAQIASRYHHAGWKNYLQVLIRELQ